MSEAADVDLGGGEPVPGDDPFSETPSDPTVGTPQAPIDLSDAPDEQRLGGVDGEPVEPVEGEFMADPEEAAEPDAEADIPEDTPPPDDPATPVTEPEPGDIEADTPADIPEDTPPPDPDPAPADGKSAVRNYIVLERLPDPDANGGADAVYAMRAVVEAHNGDGAMRKAYRKLYAEEAPESEVALVVVPESMWRPKKVKGRTKKDMAIDIG